MTEDPKLAALVEDAAEAETEPDRHRKEDAILATVAQVGAKDPNLLAACKGLDWSRTNARAVAAGLLSCIQEGVAVHPDTIRSRLLPGTDVQDAFLEDILAGKKAVDATVAADYAKTLTAQDRQRRALELGRQYIATVEGGGDVDIAIGKLSKDVLDLAEAKGLVAIHPTDAEEALAFMDFLDARRNNARDLLGLDTGFKNLNAVLNGLAPGVFVLAGAPSTGKTTLAKQIADEVAQIEKVPVLFFSFEQSKEELRIKSLARIAQVDSRAIWRGCADPKKWKEVETAAGLYFQGPGKHLTLIEAGRWDTVDAIRNAALIAKHRAGKDKPILLVLDYLQILPVPESVRLPGAKDKVDWNLSELRRLSRDIGSPILIISSENREAYKKNLPPTLASLKESGGIEYTADAVICLYRNKEETQILNERRKEPEPLRVRVEAHILKNRNGGLAKVKMDFTPALAVFFENGKTEDLDWTKALGE